MFFFVKTVVVATIPMEQRRIVNSDQYTTIRLPVVLDIRRINRHIVTSESCDIWLSKMARNSNVRLLLNTFFHTFRASAPGHSLNVFKHKHISNPETQFSPLNSLVLSRIHCVYSGVLRTQMRVGSAHRTSITRHRFPRRSTFYTVTILLI